MLVCENGSRGRPIPYVGLMERLSSARIVKGGWRPAGSRRGPARPRVRAAYLRTGATHRSRVAELAHADAYEVAAYVRVQTPLASGAQAWVYVDARGKPPAD